VATPDRVRRGLRLVAGAAAVELRAVADAAARTGSPSEIRAALFAATPLIVHEYTDGSAALALDWYEQLRDLAKVRGRGLERDLEAALTESMTLIEAKVEQEVAQAFRDTVTSNVANDPAAVGWRRYARPEACKFCKMLADRGAVYTEATARFAAHGAVMSGNRKGGNCMCIAGPEFASIATLNEATPMQYLASKRKRSEKERAQLRAYLNKNYPDAPG